MKKVETKSLGAHTRMFKWKDQSSSPKPTTPVKNVLLPDSKQIPTTPKPHLEPTPTLVDDNKWPGKVKPRRRRVNKANEGASKLDPVAQEKEAMRIKDRISKQQQSPTDKTKNTILQKIFLADLKDKQRRLEQRKEAKKLSAQRIKLQSPSPRLRLKLRNPTPSATVTGDSSNEVMEPKSALQAVPEQCEFANVEVDQTQFNVTDAVEHDPDDNNSVEILAIISPVTIVPESDEEPSAVFESSEELFGEYDLDTLNSQPFIPDFNEQSDFSQELFSEFNEQTSIQCSYNSDTGAVSDNVDINIPSNTAYSSTGFQQDDDDFQTSKPRITKKKPKCSDDLQIVKAKKKRKSRNCEPVNTSSIPNDQSRDAYSMLPAAAQDQLQTIQVGRFYNKYEDYVLMNDQLKDLYGKAAVKLTCAVCAHLGVPIAKFKKEPFHAFYRLNDFFIHYKRNHIRVCVCKICGQEFVNLLSKMGHDRKMAAHPTGLHLIATHEDSNKDGK